MSINVDVLIYPEPLCLLMSSKELATEGMRSRLTRNRSATHMTAKKVYLRNLLLSRSTWMEDRILAKAKEHGYELVTPAMSRLFGHMSSQPAGLSELARRLGVSRQAVHRLATEAARLGLVEFVQAPENARVVRLQFSQAGWAMSAQAAKDFEDLERVLRERLGARNLNELKRLLSLAWDDAEVEASSDVE